MVRASTLAPPVNPGAAGGFHLGPAPARSGGGFQGTTHEAQPMKVTNDAGGWWGQPLPSYCVIVGPAAVA